MPNVGIIDSLLGKAIAGVVMVAAILWFAVDHSAAGLLFAVGVGMAVGAQFYCLERAKPFLKPGPTENGGLFGQHAWSPLPSSYSEAGRPWVFGFLGASALLLALFFLASGSVLGPRR